MDVLQENTEGSGGKKVYVVLHNIRSAHNVGAIFRTAECAGVAKIFLTGYTPSPRDRFGRARKEIMKTALGAENSVPWEHTEEVTLLLARLKREGVTLVALEQAPQAIDYKTYTPSYPSALILGNEVRGIPESILKRCDAIIVIPLRGAKESLNVNTAAGVALFRILNI